MATCSSAVSLSILCLSVMTVLRAAVSSASSASFCSNLRCVSATAAFLIESSLLSWSAASSALLLPHDTTNKEIARRTILMVFFVFEVKDGLPK